MASSHRIVIEVDLGMKAVEKTEIFVYCDGDLIESHYNKSYNDLPGIVQRLRSQYKDASFEAWCLGEDCTGKPYRWPIEV